MEDRDLVSVIIPAYNEEESIGGDLDIIFQAMDEAGLHYEVIVVDDGSRDRTAEIARKYPRVKLMQHSKNRGSGAARKTGVRQAQGSIIVMTDADGTYPNRDIPRLVAEMAEADMVVGARGKEAGTVRWLRTPAKEFLRRLASYLVESEIPDLNSGMRAMRKDLIERYWHLLPNTHSWVGTITMAHLADGHRVKFSPIDYFPRSGGRSSFHPLRDTYNYFLLIVRTIMYFNPLKILLPLSFLFFGVAFVRQVVQMFLQGFHLYLGNILLFFVALNLAVLALLADVIVRRTR